jgi:biotin-dependent carboxylase-like uncharacterized protein
VSVQLRILAAGPGVTLQDAGRRGYLRYGVTPAGPMDAEAFALATKAAQAPAAIEVSLGGLELSVEGDALGLAVAGGQFEMSLNGRPLPPACALTLQPGEALRVRAGASGAFVYVAPYGLFDLPLALGALATHTRSGLGGFRGRGLQAGDLLPIGEARPGPVEPMRLVASQLARGAARLRVLLGPQQDHFPPKAIDAFFTARWRLSAKSDRMAYRLEGPAIRARRGHDIVSDGLAFGAIQIPGDGAPLVLMADRQPTGGYPKIAHVIGADLPALAQMRPGTELGFETVSWEEAVAARAAQARALAQEPLLEPLAPALTSEYLLGRNLVSGVSDGGE